MTGSRQIQKPIIHWQEWDRLINFKTLHRVSSTHYGDLRKLQARSITNAIENLVYTLTIEDYCQAPWSNETDCIFNLCNIVFQKAAMGILFLSSFCTCTKTSFHLTLTCFSSQFVRRESQWFISYLLASNWSKWANSLKPDSLFRTLFGEYPISLQIVLNLFKFLFMDMCSVIRAILRFIHFSGVLWHCLLQWINLLIFSIIVM